MLKIIIHFKDSFQSTSCEQISFINAEDNLKLTTQLIKYHQTAMIKADFLKSSETTRQRVDNQLRDFKSQNIERNWDIIVIIIIAVIVVFISV